jgi:hypothetical protein
LDAQNIEKSSIYTYVAAAAAAGISSNYFREQRRQSLGLHLYFQY